MCFSFSRDKGFGQERYAAPLFSKAKQAARFQVCVLVEICPELYDCKDSYAEKDAMPSGSRLPKAQADTKCLFVYLREFGLVPTVLSPAAALSTRIMTCLKKKCLKRQLASIETTPGSCFFMSLC